MGVGGSTRSATRYFTREDLEPEDLSVPQDKDLWDMSACRSSAISSAHLFGITETQMETMLDRRVKQATADFSKSLEVSPTITVSFGLYSGFKFATRKACQDRVLVKTIKTAESKEWLLTGVFDGHGSYGDKASAFCCEKMWKVVEELLSKTPTEPGKVLEKAFSAVDKSLKLFGKTNGPSYDFTLSGSTGTCALIDLSEPNIVYVAHVGDSRAIISSSDPEITSLTPLHNFDDENEVKRVYACGGIVDQIEIKGSKQGPRRIFRSRDAPSPGLAVSRSFGDTEAHEIGVSSCPDIVKLVKKDGEDLLVIASDGVWDVLSPLAVVELLDKGDYSADSVKALLLEAAKRWIYTHAGICDDISAVVVRMNSFKLKPILDSPSDEKLSSSPPPNERTVSNKLQTESSSKRLLVPPVEILAVAAGSASTTGVSPALPSESPGPSISPGSIDGKPEVVEMDETSLKAGGFMDIRQSSGSIVEEIAVISTAGVVSLSPDKNSSLGVPHKTFSDSLDSKKDSIPSDGLPSVGLPSVREASGSIHEEVIADKFVAVSTTGKSVIMKMETQLETPMEVLEGRGSIVSEVSITQIDLVAVGSPSPGEESPSAEQPAAPATAPLPPSEESVPVEPVVERDS